VEHYQTERPLVIWQSFASSQEAPPLAPGKVFSPPPAIKNHVPRFQKLAVIASMKLDAHS